MTSKEAREKVLSALADGPLSFKDLREKVGIPVARRDQLPNRMAQMCKTGLLVCYRGEDGTKHYRLAEYKTDELTLGSILGYQPVPVRDAAEVMLTDTVHWPIERSKSSYGVASCHHLLIAA